MLDCKTPSWGVALSPTSASACDRTLRVLLAALALNAGPNLAARFDGCVQASLSLERVATMLRRRAAQDRLVALG